MSTELASPCSKSLSLHFDYAFQYCLLRKILLSLQEPANFTTSRKPFHASPKWAKYFLYGAKAPPYTITLSHRICFVYIYQIMNSSTSVVDLFPLVYVLCLSQWLGWWNVPQMFDCKIVTDNILAKINHACAWAHSCSKQKIKAFCTILIYLAVRWIFDPSDLQLI